MQTIKALFKSGVARSPVQFSSDSTLPTRGLFCCARANPSGLRCNPCGTMQTRLSSNAALPTRRFFAAVEASTWVNLVYHVFPVLSFSSALFFQFSLSCRRQRRCLGAASTPPDIGAAFTQDDIAFA